MVESLDRTKDAARGGDRGSGAGRAERHAATSLWLTPARVATLLFGALLLAAGLGAPPAAADITRSCTGSFFIVITGHDGPPIAPNTHQFIRLGGLRSAGLCSGPGRANECRRMASDRARACARDVWASRNGALQQGDLPGSCFGRSAGVQEFDRFNSGQSRDHYHIKLRIERELCCRHGWRADNVRSRITFVTSGDRGCGPNRTGPGNYQRMTVLEDNYYSNCDALRRRGICYNEPPT